MSRKRYRFSRVRGPFRVVVQSRETIDDRTYYTVLHPRTGEVWTNCLPLSPGAGGLDSFAHVPIKLPDTPPSDQFEVSPERAHTAEALLYFDAYGARYLLGTTPREQKKRLLDKAEPAVEEYSSHPRTFGPGDYVVANGNGEVTGMLVVTESGRICILGTDTVRLEVKEGGKIIGHEDGRVSLPVVVLDPTLDKLNEIIARVNLNTQQLLRITPSAVDADIASAIAKDGEAATALLVPDLITAAIKEAEAGYLRQRAAQSQAWFDQTSLDAVIADADDELGSPTMTAPSRVD